MTELPVYAGGRDIKGTPLPWGDRTGTLSSYTLGRSGTAAPQAEYVQLGARDMEVRNEGNISNENII